MKNALFGLLFIYVSSVSYVHADNKIIWYALNAPPAYILSGADKGNGYVEKVQQLVINKLPQYQHQFRQVKFNQLITDMVKGLPVCFSALSKTQEQQSYVDFSQQSIINLNFHVIIKKANINPLIEFKNINLEVLLKFYRLTTSQPNIRRYGAYIDKILYQFPELIDKSAQSSFDQFKQLAEDKIDFLIESPSVAHYVLKQMGNTEAYLMLPIVGIAQFSQGFIGCSKGDWGQKAIKDINNALTQIKNSNPYLSALTHWLSPENLNEEFYSYYLNEFQVIE